MSFLHCYTIPNKNDYDNDNKINISINQSKCQFIQCLSNKSFQRHLLPVHTLKKHAFRPTLKCDLLMSVSLSSDVRWLHTAGTDEQKLCRV